MRRPPRWYHVLAGIFAALSLLTISFMLAFLVTSWLYPQIGLAPPTWVQQLINSILGFVFLVCIAGTIGYFTRSKQRSLQMGFFGPIVDALGQIAKGDYSVRLPADTPQFRDNEPVSVLVKSVNTLAEELNQMEAMRQEFISNVSHEIQSPLTSIRGFARALQDDNLTGAERAHYLNIIEMESTRLARLTENLLALASLDSESYTLDLKPYRLDLQIRDIVLACEPQWKEKQIEMDVATVPVTLNADKDLLNQVWLNLIHNSVKFTPPRGTICIALRPCAESVEFRITDTGIGISPADRARIFERFFKADTSRERARGGSGLGLAITQKIVEMHHGTIQVASTLGMGSTFTVILPNPPN